MKNIRLMSFVTLLVALFMSAGAYAQDIALSIDKCYLMPGNVGKVMIKIDNKAEKFTGLYTEITLPEGLTFVEKGDECVYNTTDITKGNIVFLVTKKDKNNVASLTVSNGYDFTPCEGDFISFDVNVGDNLAALTDITFDNTSATYYDYENDSYTDISITAKANGVYNEDELYTPSVEDFAIKAGETKTISFGFDYDKHAVMGVAFNVELPEGLSIDPKSYTPCEDRLPAHQILVRKSGRVSCMPTGAGELDFIGTSGPIFTFDVTASEDFAGGVIKYYDLDSRSQSVNGVVPNWYAKDFTVNVTLDNGPATGINGVESFSEAADGIYQLNGVRTDKLQRGVNVVVKNGKAIKVVKK